ncbi:unnamed protein product [Rhizoctonia solani]|uniref:BTB domain-containing protein n=1 Tax=Rhizoctonia solani TaxID=456999 RepID=A0A8H3A496_9AGAM|nr:unnamed protein product [Rhizoctonia solani]
MESPTISCASLSDASISELGSHAPNLADAYANSKPNDEAPPECPEYEGTPLFEPGDGDMQISVNGTCFETHKYLIKRFQALKLLLNGWPLRINIQHNAVSAEDFREMFKVIYASIVTGPSLFAPSTLISTLRVATIYEYQALRDYCIQYLERLELDAVKRIEIAREFHLPAWEGPASYELGMRDEPITKEEAKIIGLDAFVCIAEMREKEQRRRGEEINAMGRAQDTKSSLTKEVSIEVETKPDEPEVAALVEINPDEPEVPAPGSTPQCVQPMTDDERETNDTAAHVNNNGTETGQSFTGVELSGTYNKRSTYGYRIDIPGCKCHFTSDTRSGVEKCTTYPCSLSALKNIQVQQSAHANRISDLESSVKKFSASIAAKSAPIGIAKPPVLEHGGDMRPKWKLGIL